MYYYYYYLLNFYYNYYLNNKYYYYLEYFINSTTIPVLPVLSVNFFFIFDYFMAIFIQSEKCFFV